MLESRDLQIPAGKDDLKHAPESSWHVSVKTNTGAVLFLPYNITWSVCFSTAIISYFCFKNPWTNINFLSHRNSEEKQKTALLWHPVFSEGTFQCLQLMVLGSSQLEEQHCCSFLLSGLGVITVRGQTGCIWALGGFKESRLVALFVPCSLLESTRNAMAPPGHCQRHWQSHVAVSVHGLSHCPILLDYSYSQSAINQYYFRDCWLRESAFYCFMCLFSFMVYLPP